MVSSFDVPRDDGLLAYSSRKEKLETKDVPLTHNEGVDGRMYGPMGCNYQIRSKNLSRANSKGMQTRYETIQRLSKWMCL